MQAVRVPTLTRPRWLAPVAWVWSRRPPTLIALAALFCALFLVDHLLYLVTLPVTISADGALLTVNVGGAPLVIPSRSHILSVTLPDSDPVVHEFQIDDTDSTNNFTLDAAYLHSIADTPYYRFYAWMRDLDGLSRWRNVCVFDTERRANVCDAAPSRSGATLRAQAWGTGEQWVTASIQRPETPVSLVLNMSDGSRLTVTVDRNDRAIQLAHGVGAHPDEPVTHVFFPVSSAPFAAMVADFMVRVALWALLLLMFVCGAAWLVGWLQGAIGVWVTTSEAPATAGSAAPGGGVVGWLRGGWERLSAAIHPVGLVALALSFGYVAWIALAQYAAQPHIYDASAYLFGAKIYAQGHLWAPIPAAMGRFNGPFMLARDGKWFTQYEPGTSLALAAGVALGVPWLVEPLLGTLSLLGVGLIAHRLYDRRVATLAVSLGAISPLYSYIAASYLSHAVAVFYLVWGWYALLRALMDGPTRRSAWLLPVAGMLWILAVFTRQTSVIFVMVAFGGLLWLAWVNDWPALYPKRLRRWLLPLVTLAALSMFALIGYFVLNRLLTGAANVTPRAMFAPDEHWGFGPGVGFYGAHTLASGFITIDELLTSLAIALYGWPFYLTLAFLALPFLLGRAKPADMVMLVGAAGITFAFVGYFYPGIYLGPRCLYDALPFLLMLTARGFVALAEAESVARANGERWGERNPLVASLGPLPFFARALTPTVALSALLFACWGGYYVPRQIALHNDFTGMGAGVNIKTGLLSRPPLHHAIVITGDNQLYGYTLFALNDPLLRGDVLYAEGASASDYAELRRAFPDRRLYLLTIQVDGTPRYSPIEPSLAP